MQVHLSLAAYPGLHVQAAARLAAKEHHDGTLCEPGLGQLSLAHVQLVPQNAGVLDAACIEAVRAALPPSTRLRPHANCRVLPEHRFADLARFPLDGHWWSRARDLAHELGCGAWSVHSGARSHASVSRMLDHARRANDLMGGRCQVAVEGQYPAAGRWLIDRWSEYEMLLEQTDVPYCVDLSHLHIVVQEEGRQDDLVRCLLASPRCLEVHLSGNDGRADQHRILDGLQELWWQPLLQHIHPECVVFTEGNRLRVGAGLLAQ